MLRRFAAAMLFASAVIGAPAGSARAQAPPASPFEIVPRRIAEHRPHRAAWACILGGAGLLAASFPLADAADRRYAEYLNSNEPTEIDRLWNATVRADHVANGSLLAGEALLVAGVAMRFLGRDPRPRVAFAAVGTRCLVAVRF